MCVGNAEEQPTEDASMMMKRNKKANQIRYAFFFVIFFSNFSACNLKKTSLGESSNTSVSHMEKFIYIGVIYVGGVLLSVWYRSVKNKHKF